MEKVKSPQQLWNERNREKTRLYCVRARQLKKGVAQKELPKPKPIERLKEIETSLFKILDVLRKDNRHYLWNKHIYKWSISDWKIYNILKNS